MSAGSASSSGYRAFVSYSHQDQAWARWLHKAIETYRVPNRLVGQRTAAGVIPRRLAPIFRDRDELPSATDLNRKVNEALAASANLIVICSPAAATSHWVDEEVRTFKRLGRADRIFCLVIGGEPNATDLPGREHEECFCPSLRFGVDAQGALTRERNEPIAADARPGADGRNNARLKLIAGLIDVGFDALKQREQQRRNRKWAALAAASFAGMLVTGGLSVYALRARSEAIAQRGEAEGLIEFMLGDLRKKLEPVGRLDALDSVGERALKYYSAQDAGSLDADSLGRRARALHLIGEVDDLRGNLDHALDVFEQAARSTSELLARSPNDGQRIFDHAQSVYWVGYVAFERGQNDVAERAWNDYRALAERLVAVDPRKADWQAEVGYAYSNLGTLMIKEGRAKEAVAAFEHSLKVSSALARESPTDLGRQLDDAQSHAWLADANEDQGQLREATMQRQAELAIYQAVLASDPNNNDAKSRLLVCRHALARLSMAKGQLQPSIDLLRGTSDIADALMKSEPDSTLWAEFAAHTYVALGEALHYAGDDSDARIEADRAVSITQTLVKRDASVVRWSAYLLSRGQLLQVSLHERSDAASLATAIEIVRRIDAIPHKEAGDQLIRWQLGAALLAEGDLQHRLDSEARAREAWERVVSVLGPTRDSENAAMQTLLATALTRLRRHGEASPLIARLESIDYAHPDFVALKASIDDDAGARKAVPETSRPSTLASARRGGTP